MATPAAIARAWTATARFGLGARPGEIDAAAGDPRRWVLEQLRPQALPSALAGLPDGIAATLKFQEVRRAVLQGRVPAPGGANPEAAQRALRDAVPGPLPRELYLREAGARMQAQIDSATPVVERLVAFWSNHFTVSVQRPPVLTLAGPFEREAIRPHVLGRFADMLVAVARHQAMLLYLDNANSFGPGSRIGQRRQRGLNENLAREILELHTLGVDGGYGQDDVRALATILTGWSIAGAQEPGAGAFRFRPFAHEPGPKTLLGRRYAEAGEREGIDALGDLARHPATARHVATRLARHFIADEPPAASVERLARVFLETGGDLLQVTRALVADDAAWAQPMAKLRQPTELVTAALRALAPPADGPGRRPIADGPLIGSLRRLGQAPFAAPSPAGWPDSASDWVGPEAMMRRIEWASALAARVAADRAPMALFEATIGPVASARTREAVERAPSARDGIALLFASPEFQRR